MHVPAHLQEIARKLALRSWIEGKDFPLEHYFETIEGAGTLLGRHKNADSANPRPELVVNVVAGALDEEGLLLTQVLKAGTYDVDGEDPEGRWFKICQAAAWVIYQSFEKECSAGKWPK